jgi:hypothetical protein
MPARSANDSGFKAPPRPELEGGGGAARAGAGSSVTLKDALPDPPVSLDVQVIAVSISAGPDSYTEGRATVIQVVFVGRADDRVRGEARPAEMQVAARKELCCEFDWAGITRG